MIEKFIKSAKEFNDDFKNDPNGRYRSWQYCYYHFYKARQQEKLSDADYDYLSLQLYQYLASWGMLRASFLLWKDYKIHIPAIKEMLKPEYDCLQGVTCKAFQEEKIQTIWEKLNSQLSDYYDNVRKTVQGKENVQNKISSVLLSKILLGTLGCTPAYDRFFVSIVRENGITGLYGINSLKELSAFYERHYDELEKFRKTLDFDGIPYPQMKLLDMGFWQLGFDAEQNAKK